jgi:hypothetical protein
MYLFRVLITYLILELFLYTERKTIHDILPSLEMKIGEKYEIACEKF